MARKVSEARPSANLIVALVKCNKHTVTELGALVEPFELGVEDWLILDALARAGKLSMSEIAEETISTGATLTRAVTSLVSRALVYRQTSIEDRRRVDVHLSKRGAELHAELAPAVARLDAELRAVTAAAPGLIEALDEVGTHHLGAAEAANS